MPTICIIVAVAHKRAIGRNGDLVFRLRPDMRHFRKITMGHPLIMGRKTRESLPGGSLGGRRNMVVSSNPQYQGKDIEVFGSLQDAISALDPTDEAMVIGGAQIYNLTLPIADRIYLTEIDADAPDADTFFPHINPEIWEERDSTEWLTDPETGLRYRFCCLYRR